MSAYVYTEYPKWKYHPDRDPIIVPDSEAEKALGDGWFNSKQEAENAKTQVVDQLMDLQRMPRRKVK